MTEDAQRKTLAYVDFTRNNLDSLEWIERMKATFREEYELRLDESIQRIRVLPTLTVYHTEATALLREARELYVRGHFYSCVAMCGIVGERIIKDVIRAVVMVRRGDEAKTPSESAFTQLERIDSRSLIQFLRQTGTFTDKVKKAAIDLGDLRNNYAHARGKNPEADALTAIKLLHEIVDSTIAMSYHYTIKDGYLVPKTTPREDAGTGSDVSKTGCH